MENRTFRALGRVGLGSRFDVRSSDPTRPMSFSLVADAASVTSLATHLQSASRVALDCEAAGFHRYSDQLCLMQLTVSDATFIIDPLAVDPKDLLQETLENEEVQIVMHGADYDLRLLDRDLAIQVQGLFDTQAAASLLGEEGLGLATLLERHFGIELSKKYQRADWARRPLPPEMLEYAASDTRYLLKLADLLQSRLEAEGRSSWASEEFAALEAIRWQESEADPVTRVKGARALEPRQVEGLRAALDWRDSVARRQDRAPFRIAGDGVLVEAVMTRPQTLEELGDLKGFNPRLARTEGSQLLGRLREIDGLDPGDLVPFPPSRGNGRGRPPPKVEARLERLKSARNARSEKLNIARGTLLPNSVLLEIAWVEPKTLDDLGRVDGIKRWQVATVGEAMLSRMATNS